VMPRGRVGVWACGRRNKPPNEREWRIPIEPTWWLHIPTSPRRHAHTSPIFASTRDPAGDQSGEQAINSGSDAGRHGRRQVPFLILEFLCFFDVLRGWNRLGIPFLANIPFVVR
jgi:hypothetical protein